MGSCLVGVEQMLALLALLLLGSRPARSGRGRATGRRVGGAPPAEVRSAAARCCFMMLAQPARFFLLPVLLPLLPLPLLPLLPTLESTMEERLSPMKSADTTSSSV